ncbi:YciI family protein [Occultella aeris]|uniref:YCII-related domain protein n=1 Tax=Occultella aeris TaxID=2761496 RepID=A0A7M4DGA0_9MICO|nr:YciI family protein [Occultella aeris]VZO35943.1 YCII-related domain protein [Occultella aeris]
MTQYFLTIPHDTAEEPTMVSMQELDPAELEAMMAAVDKFNTDLNAAGAFITAGGLQPPSTAITVDATGTETTRTPGPFVEATEYVGGFWIIEASDEERALTWAEQASAALGSRIEVRALQEEPEQD